MGFFDTLRRVLTGNIPEGTPREATGEVRGSNAQAEITSLSDSESTSPYDRAQWQRKLKRILDGLPESRGEWAELLSEAKALNLDPRWVADCHREEFLLLIRRVVSDRVVTEEEHRKLDLCRDLIGMSDDDAETALHAVVAEAESFFGKPVREA